MSTEARGRPGVRHACPESGWRSADRIWRSDGQRGRL